MGNPTTHVPTQTARGPTPARARAPPRITVATATVSIAASGVTSPLTAISAQDCPPTIELSTTRSQGTSQPSALHSATTANRAAEANPRRAYARAAGGNVRQRVRVDTALEGVSPPVSKGCALRRSGRGKRTRPGPHDA